MMNEDIQEQYALLEEEKREDRRKTIIIIILCILILLITMIGLYFAYSNNSGDRCTLNCDTDGDGIPDTNIDLDGDGKCDINCRVVGSDGK